MMWKSNDKRHPDQAIPTRLIQREEAILRFEQCEDGIRGSRELFLTGAQKYVLRSESNDIVRTQTPRGISSP